MALLLASCVQAPTALECKALANPKAVVQRCYGGKVGASARYVGDLKCWPFSKPKRLRGIWAIDLETSEFFPDAASFNEASGRPIWLESDELENRPELRHAAQGAGRRAYAVEMEGREALCDGYFGHMGMSPRQVIAERFYSIRPLPIPTS